MSNIQLTELIFIVEQPPEGGYIARALGESIFTQGDTLEALRQNVREATECHFDEGRQPKLIRLHFVREEVLLPNSQTNNGVREDRAAFLSTFGSWKDERSAEDIIADIYASRDAGKKDRTW